MKILIATTAGMREVHCLYKKGFMAIHRDIGARFLNITHILTGRRIIKSIPAEKFTDMKKIVDDIVKNYPYMDTRDIEKIKKCEYRAFKNYCKNRIA